MTRRLLTSLTSTFLIIFTIVTLFIPNFQVQAGGGRIEMTITKSGVATGEAGQVEVIIYNEERSQVSVGESGQFRFESPQSGQTCNTPNQVSDSQGKVKGTCSSPVPGTFSILFTTTNGSNAANYMSFTTPPPAPQNLSGQYKLVTDRSSISLTNQINTGYSYVVFLKDAQNGQPIYNQSEITYEWKSNDTSIVQVNTSSYCEAYVQTPCPQVRGELRGFKPGTTDIRTLAKKGGQIVAEINVQVTVTQTTSGESSYKPSPVPTPTPSPAASASPTPSPSASPKVSPSPVASVTPEATVSAVTATPSPSPTTTMTQPVIATAAPVTSKWLTLPTVRWEIGLLVVSMMVGIGWPIGVYSFHHQPTFRHRVLHWLRWWKKN